MRSSEKREAGTLVKHMPSLLDNALRLSRIGSKPMLTGVKCHRFVEINPDLHDSRPDKTV
jgi:hypothetical protein